MFKMSAAKLLLAALLSMAGVANLCADTSVSKMKPTPMPTLAPTEAQSSGSALKDEREVLERQADRHYNGLVDVLDKMLWALGVIAAAAFGLFYYFFGKTKDEIKVEIKKLMEPEAKKALEETKQAIELSQHDLKARVKELSVQVDRSIPNRDIRILWIAANSAQLANDPFQTEIAALGLAGFSGVSMIFPEPQGTQILLDTFDLVVVSGGEAEPELTTLNGVVGRLSEMAKIVPLIIYTRTQIPPDRLATLFSRFTWIAVVNVPLQLITQCTLLLGLIKGQSEANNG